jgi:predicted DCC family thiol-disulfide oxidoreductase YuxK
VTPTERVAAPPSKPLLVFDGDCNFCRRWIARWQQATGDRVEYLPYQDASIAARFPEIPKEQFTVAVQLIETDGRVTRAAEAVVRSLAYAPYAGVWAALYRSLPGFASLSERAYRMVAGNRAAFSRLTRLRWGDPPEPPSCQLLQGLFLRMLGVIYFIAFVSLWTQISGLIGSNGILPAAQTMQGAREYVAAGQLGIGRYLLLPTLCWLNTSDGFLQFLCGGGAVLAALLIVGIAPVPVLALLWLFYLSIVSVGNVFLSFQWDVLLLETGFLAIFFAPLRWRRKHPAFDSPPSTAVLWLLRLLLFKLMFFSGAVKLTSRDPTWANLSALKFHYYTQPLPNPIAWYAHQLPDWFQEMSVFVMFVIELVVPFFLFAPRRWRLWAFWPLVGLQLLIIATGNYCFFNLLTIALCVVMLDDRVLERVKAGGASARRLLLSPEPGPRTEAAPALSSPLRWPGWIIAPVAIVVLTINFMLIGRLFGSNLQRWPAPFLKLYQTVAPFHAVNSYGLFAVMTTSRPEIILEGSRDGQNWQAYEFKYKPGDLTRAPCIVAPHQPRLDWQMWFAALGDIRGNPWMLSFCEKLLRGSPEVLALVKDNPFPESPPRYVRAVLYDYHFTDFATRRKEGTWWRRELKGAYCPELSLRE